MDTLTKNLKVKAKDNHGLQYPVSLRFEKFSAGQSRQADGSLRPDIVNKWVLRIHNTPASWYMATLLEGKTGSVIALDYGQNWNCINFDEVMKEAKEQI